ncbi:MAG: aldose 1-epimerase family protein [Planctomyces sp.]
MTTPTTHEFLNCSEGIYDTQNLLTGSSDSSSKGIAGATAEKPRRDFASRCQWQIGMQRLSGGLSDGVDIVNLDNGRLKLKIIPTRGMGIWKGEVDGIPLQWNSPVPHPVHPGFVDQMRRGGLGWLDGFNELICRCGLGWNGAPGDDIVRDVNGNIVSQQFLPLHGRIANLPAHRVYASTSSSSLSVTGIVEEGCLFGGRMQLTSTVSTSPGSASFSIRDVVRNLAGSPAEVELLYHCNIGEPFLGEGSVYHGVSHEVAPRDRNAANAVSMWNLFQGPTANFQEQCYYTSAVPDERGDAIGVLCSPNSDLAFCIRFSTTTLPWLTLWKNTQLAADGYVTGLEPGSSFPNNRTFERSRGRVLSVAPGEEVVFDLQFEIATTKVRVKEILDEVTERQIRAPRTVHSEPKGDWSP